MKEFKHAAAIAKLYATESAVTGTRIATQVFGGYGFMEEYPVARHFYRDAKVLEIGEGTSEVQRMLIAVCSACPWNECERRYVRGRPEVGPDEPQLVEHQSQQRQADPDHVVRVARHAGDERRRRVRRG